MFKSVGALAIYVTDLERAKEFYTKVLGFELAADVTSTLCFLRSTSGGIDIYMEGGKREASVDRESCRLSFFLRPEASASAVYEALKAAGVEVLGEGPEFVGDDTYCFQFLDPDGNILEVAGGP